MALISTHDKTFQLQQGETLLEGLERTGHEVAGLLKTSSLIVGSASKSRIYLMSIYLKTNKNAV